MNEITKRTIESYKNYLIEEEKSSVTIEKYIRDITTFVNWTEGNEITKALVLEYKSMLALCKHAFGRNIQKTILICNIKMIE